MRNYFVRVFTPFERGDRADESWTADREKAVRFHRLPF